MHLEPAEYLKKIYFSIYFSVVYLRELVWIILVLRIRKHKVGQYSSVPPVVHMI